jgi:ABC-type phosphate transport system permease subunit
MGYSTGDHRTALFAAGIILFVFIMALNILANLLMRKK